MVGVILSSVVEGATLLNAFKQSISEGSAFLEHVIC